MDDETKQTPVDIGSQLKDARLRRRLSLDDVSSQLHIRRDYLQAIETGEWERLPGHVYGLGFLRSYARLLDLDGDVLVEEQRRRLGMGEPSLPQNGPVGYRPRVGRSKDPKPGRVTSRRRKPTPMPVHGASNRKVSVVPLWLVAAIAVLFVGGLFLMPHGTLGLPPHHAASGSQTPKVKTSHSPTNKSSATKTKPAATLTLLSQNTSTGTLDYRINRRPVAMTIRFSGPCWVELWNNGVTHNPYGHVYQSGQTLTTTANSVAVKLGNHHVAITVNGQALHFPPSSPMVLTVNVVGH